MRQFRAVVEWRVFAVRPRLSRPTPRNRDRRGRQDLRDLPGNDVADKVIDDAHSCADLCTDSGADTDAHVCADSAAICCATHRIPDGSPDAGSDRTSDGRADAATHRIPDGSPDAGSDRTSCIPAMRSKGLESSCAPTRRPSLPAR